MQVSVYQIMSNLGFINHLYGYIIMSMGTDVISIYIFIQFMENISVSLDESAFIDGASYFTIYWKIILGSKYNLICAGVLMSLLPALIVFLLCQKQIYSGITSGAVKG